MVDCFVFSLYSLKDDWSVCQRFQPWGSWELTQDLVYSQQCSALFKLKLENLFISQMTSVFHLNKFNKSQFTSKTQKSDFCSVPPDIGLFSSCINYFSWHLLVRDGCPAPRGKQAAPPQKTSLLPRPVKYHCCPAPPRGGGQNCGAFVGQNENHTLNFINGDND